ncbi:hypothetical protein D3C73_1340280 [compost metagenome]
MQIQCGKIGMLSGLDRPDWHPQDVTGAGGAHPVDLLGGDAGTVQAADLLQKRTHAHLFIHADPVVAAAPVCSQCHPDSRLEQIRYPCNPVRQEHVAGRAIGQRPASAADQFYFRVIQPYQMNGDHPLVEHTQ